MLGPVVLPGREGVHELELEEGRIAAIRPAAAATGQLALPTFVDLHVHADRAFARGPRPPRSLVDAIELVADVKRASTEELIRERATRLFERAFSHGTQRIRTHVDVDELVDQRALRGVIAAREELSGRLQVEIVALATARTDPSSPDGARRLASALAAGADLVGGVPAFHPDPPASLEALLDLALEHGVDADLHLDETIDPSGFQLERLADATIARELEGRVTAGHCCALASVDDETARRTIAKVAEAGVTVVALPALNLYLEDRGASTPRYRGITRVRELAAAGVAVRFGSDNVQDVFYPYGDADPLEAAWLAALAAHVDDEDVLLAGICDGRTGIEVGDPADLVLVDADSLREALARRPEEREIVRAGELLRT